MIPSRASGRFGFRLAGIAGVAGALAVGGAAAAHAQAAAHTGAADALILVQPLGDAAEVSLTYPRHVDHVAARQALDRLAKLGGWRIGAVDVRDETPTIGPRGSQRQQTGADALISGASLVDGKAFRLQPFFDAFHGLNRFELLYLVPRQTGFNGLQYFDSPYATVRLVTGGSPYRYEFDIHEHVGAAPVLPVVQAAAPTSGTSAAARQEQGTSVWPIVALAVGCGLACYAALRLYARGRSRTRRSRGSVAGSAQSRPYRL